MEKSKELKVQPSEANSEDESIERERLKTIQQMLNTVAMLRNPTPVSPSFQEVTHIPIDNSEEDHKTESDIEEEEEDIEEEQNDKEEEQNDTDKSECDCDRCNNRPDLALGSFAIESPQFYPPPRCPGPAIKIPCTDPLHESESPKSPTVPLEAISKEEQEIIDKTIALSLLEKYNLDLAYPQGGGSYLPVRTSGGYARLDISYTKDNMADQLGLFKAEVELKAMNSARENIAKQFNRIKLTSAKMRSEAINSTRENILSQLERINLS